MILITGANGFVGTAFADRLSLSPHHVKLATRNLTHFTVGGETCVVGDIGSNTEWTEALVDVSVIVHTAARVHVLDGDVADPITSYRQVNVSGTLNLARQAAKAGVRRFVFVSSIKVNGERTTMGAAYKADDEPCPEDPYGISKYEAEVGLRQIAHDTGMELVIVRPPLVYGPGVKGNFSILMRWLKRGIPLPLGAVTRNRRSMVALDNLVDLMVTCIDHPAAANETFLVSDSEDLSTTDLLRRLGVAMGKQPHLFPVPPKLLQAAAKLLGKRDMAQRLLGNLQVDITHTCQTLNWTPPITVDEGLRRAVQGLSE